MHVFDVTQEFVVLYIKSFPALRVSIFDKSGAHGTFSFVFLQLVLLPFAVFMPSLLVEFRCGEGMKGVLL